MTSFARVLRALLPALPAWPGSSTCGLQVACKPEHATPESPGKSEGSPTILQSGTALGKRPQVSPPPAVVQMHMRRDAANLAQLLGQQGGNLYVCGDAKYMAKDVHQTLLSLYTQHLVQAFRVHIGPANGVTRAAACPLLGGRQ